MKIAMISGGGGSGGLLAYIRGMLSVKTEDEVLFICTPSLRDKLGDVAENIHIFALEQAKERGIEILLNKPLHTKVVEIVHAFSPDVILYINGWIRKGLEQYPNLMILHNQLYIDNVALKQTLTRKNMLSLLSFRYIVRRSMRKAAGVIFLSEESMSGAKENGVRFRNGKVIYFGLSQENLRKTATEHSEKDVYNLLYISTFWGYKNHEKLLDALRILKQKGYKFQMRFVGAGPKQREEKVKSYARKLCLLDDVVFCGNVPHDTVIAEIDNADVFVYPSAVESTGLGVMEAMARGACVACSDKSCMHEVLSDAGVYFNPDEPKTIAEVLARLLTDVSARTTLSIRGLQAAKMFSWDRVAKETFEMFSSVLRK